MRINILAIIFTLCCTTAFAQDIQSKNAKANFLRYNKNTPSENRLTENNVPVLLDGKLTDSKNINYISPQNIEFMTVWKGQRAKEKFGDFAENGLIEITSKHPQEILTYRDLVLKYHFDPQLPVMVNSTLIKDKNRLLIDAAIINEVKTLDESPETEPKVPLMPGEKLVKISVKM